MVAIVGPNGAGKSTLFGLMIQSKVNALKINIDTEDRIGLVY